MIEILILIFITAFLFLLFSYCGGTILYIRVIYRILKYHEELYIQLGKPDPLMGHYCPNYPDVYNFVFQRRHLILGDKRLSLLSDSLLFCYGVLYLSGGIAALIGAYGIFWSL